MDTQAVLEWFDAVERPLPWREPGTSAWGVLLSEVMSQQTPVARVAPQWKEWMERCPTRAGPPLWTPQPSPEAWASAPSTPATPVPPGSWGSGGT